MENSEFIMLLYFGLFVLAVCLIVSFFQMKIYLKKVAALNERLEKHAETQLRLFTVLCETLNVPLDKIQKAIWK